MKNEYDTIFIGSGHACWHGALILRQFGQSVALVDKDVWGGTCTNYGCDAKILLDSPFELKEGLDRYKGLGLKQEAKLDWKELMAYKKQVIGFMPAALEGLFGQFGFDLIKGEAKFIDEHTIEVNGEQYKAKNFVIGTGQNYVPLEIPGKECFHGSREFLDLDEIPEHVTFVGAGIIGMEFASLCLSLGKKVDIIDLADHALGMYQQDYVDVIVNKMKEQGANFLFSRNVSSIEKKDENEYLLKTKEGDEIATNYVLIAVGRKANVEGLGLEKLGIKFSSRGIEVDSHLRTEIKNIYASGDVIDKRIPKLTPTAEFESNYIARDILNPQNEEIHYPVVPNLVFTLPRIAQVGVSEAEAKERGLRIEKVDLGRTMAWLNKNQRTEKMTLVFNEERHLVGASVLSDDAGAYIDLLTIVINKKLGAEDLGNMIFAFPTQTYGVMTSLIPLFLKA